LRGNGEVIKREEFEKRKAAAESARSARLNRQPTKLASQGKDLSKHPLLRVRPARIAAPKLTGMHAEKRLSD
jgi:Domain of unknown function (DUF4464)